MTVQSGPGRTDDRAWSAGGARPAASAPPHPAVGFLRRRGWVIALMMTLCVFGGLLFELTSVPRYVSTAQIIIDPREVQAGPAGAAPRGETGAAMQSLVGSEMRVLTSNTLLSKLIDSEDLTHDPEFVRGPFDSIAGLRGLLGDRFRGTVDAADSKRAALQQLDRLIAVRHAEESSVIDVSATTANPDKSARWANRLVDLYIAQTREARAEFDRRTAAGRDDRLRDLQEQVRAAEARVETFRQDNHLDEAGGPTVGQAFRDLNDQLTQARAHQNEDRARVEGIERLRADPRIDIQLDAPQSPSVIQLRSRFAEAVRRRTALAKQLGPRHPDYIAADEAVQVAQHAFEQELQRVAQAARTQYGRSKQREEALERSVDALSRAAQETGKAVPRLHDLEREADMSRALLASFVSRSQDLAEQRQLQTDGVRQIRTALPAARRANPSAAMVLAVALALGLALGTVLAALMEAGRALRAGRS